MVSEMPEQLYAETACVLLAGYLDALTSGGGGDASWLEPLWL